MMDYEIKELIDKSLGRLIGGLNEIITDYSCFMDRILTEQNEKLERIAEKLNDIEDRMP